MITYWNEARDRVEALHTRAERSRCMEARRRARLGAWGRDVLFRYETALWVSVTAAIWLRRRNRQDSEERSGPLAEVLASLWIMNRWRRLAERASQALQENDRPAGGH
ncbi:hypothetical protein [Elongatibacter sediminis]|uniref:Transposase DDE domain-containing protein n=1 Tax=Elongatibacter sediminis TaxID=3119006 RepID=A0AAW9RJU9_9GAMM